MSVLLQVSLKEPGIPSVHVRKILTGSVADLGMLYETHLGNLEEWVGIEQKKKGS